MANLIFEKMARILAKVDCIEKGRTNQHQGFKFRGIDDALNTLHNVFAEEKVFLLHEVMEHSVTERQTAKGGASFHHIVKVMFRFVADDGSQVSAVGIGEAADTGDKGAGKAMSYALKVCLLQTFLIPTEEEKDPDASTTTWGQKQAVAQKPNQYQKAAESFAQMKKFESRVDKAQEERELIQSCEKQLQSVGTEPYEYPKHKDLVVAAAKELGISSPRLSAHREQLNEFLYTAAYSNHASVKSAMETFFSQLPGGTK